MVMNGARGMLLKTRKLGKVAKEPKGAKEGGLGGGAEGPAARRRSAEEERKRPAARGEEKGGRGKGAEGRARQVKRASGMDPKDITKPNEAAT